MTRLAIILVTCALWSVASVAAAGQSRTPVEYEKVDTFVNRPLGFAGIQSLANLRKLGLVKDEKVGVVANRHYPKQNDEIRTLQFDGLVIEAYFPARDHNRGIITGIIVTKPQWKLRHGLNVGVAAKEVEAILGKPDESGPDRMSYSGDTASGTFFIRGNRVIKVVFEGSVD